MYSSWLGKRSWRLQAFIIGFLEPTDGKDVSLSLIGKEEKMRREEEEETGWKERQSVWGRKRRWGERFTQLGKRGAREREREGRKRESLHLPLPPVNDL